MFHVAFILAIFLYQLSIGCMVSLALMPLVQVDRKFYQLSSGLSSILVAIGILINFFYRLQMPESFGRPPINFQLWYYLSLAILGLYFLITLILYIRMRRDQLDFSKNLVRISASLGVLGLAAFGLLFRPESLTGGLKNWVVPLDFVSGAMFLGVFMLAMVFGHWYLVKAMPKKLLRRMAELLIVILIVRLLVFLMTLSLLAYQVPNGDQILASLINLSWGGQGMFFWQRVILGLVIPLVLSFMVWSTAKIGANQSATGLLYVGVVFVIIGELVSKYIFVISGVPI